MGINGLKATATHPHIKTLYIDAPVKHIKGTFCPLCALHVAFANKGKFKETREVIFTYSKQLVAGSH